MVGGLRRLEAATGGSFTYRHRGQVRELPSPQGWPYEKIRAALQQGASWMPRDMPMPKAEALFEAWRLHYDLPTPQNTERLFYFVEHWPDALEADLHQYARSDLGDLWRARQWRKILVLMDHLPGHSNTQAVSANDPEYAKIVAEHLEANPPEDDKRRAPPLQQWSPVVATLNDLIEVVERWGWQNVAATAGGAKNIGIPPPKPRPRPETALSAARERAAYERKLAKHESLVARLLPHKAD